MASFVDEYERQLDNQGRIILPPKVREAVADTAYVTQAPNEKCLHLYTSEEWEKMSEKINALPTTTDPNAAAFVRMFFGKATAASVDKQGRMPVAKRLIEYAGIKKDVILVGANKHLEIWDVEEWQRYQDGLSGNIMIEGIRTYQLNI